MVRPPIFVDQTLNQGLKQNLSPDQLAELVRYMTELGLTDADIQVAAWQSLGRNFMPPFAQYRAVIDPCVHQVENACKSGFKIVNIAIFYHENVETDSLLLALVTAKRLGLNTVLQIRNASELSTQAIGDFVASLEWSGLDSIMFCDEAGLLDPMTTYHTCMELKKRIAVELEFCAYNKMGLATANTLAALRAGIRKVTTAVAGIDSYAAFEEIVLGYRFLLNQPIEISSNLAPLSRTVVSCLGREVAVNKPIIGHHVFAHESGIHVDGVIKNPELYEPFAPELVGLSRRLVIGKHSGTASLKAKFLSWNLPLTDFDASLLLGIVRRKAINQKSPLNDCQLIDLYDEMLGRGLGCEAGGDEICRAEKKYSLSIQRYGMVNKRPVLFSQRRKSWQ
jgi:homocitrate synthase NifV